MLHASGEGRSGPRGINHRCLGHYLLPPQTMHCSTGNPSKIQGGPPPVLSLVIIPLGAPTLYPTRSICIKFDPPKLSNLMTPIVNWSRILKPPRHRDPRHRRLWQRGQTAMRTNAMGHHGHLKTSSIGGGGGWKP